MQLRTILALISCCFCVGLFAQTTAERAANRAADRTERRAQSKVDRTVDQAVDDTFNAIGNLFKKKKKKNKKQPSAPGTATTPAGNNGQATPVGREGQTRNNGGADPSEESMEAIGKGNDEPYEGYTNPHTFSMDMEITETKKNGKVVKNTVSMAVTEDRFAIVTKDIEGKGTGSQMIFNTEDGKTTMVTTDKNGVKTGIRMKMPGTGRAIHKTVEDMADRFNFTQTGERKTIDGYNCEKIMVEDTKRGTTTESWITQDLKLSSADIFSGIRSAFGGKAQMGKGSMMNQPVEGFPILSTTVEKGKTYVTKFRNIRVGTDKYDRSLMDISGVRIQSLGF
mgnify:CR=1 FL=1